MNTNTVNKKYVSALTLQNSGGSIDVRQIMRPLINVTNEELSFLDVLELQGRKEVTATDVFHSGSTWELPPKLHDFNLFGYFKKFQSITFQTFRNRSDFIRMIDGKFYRMFVTRVLTNQSNIRTVKCCN